MKLLDNWLVQAIIGNVACFILSRVLKSFIRYFSTPPKTEKTTYYSKSALRKEFYISLTIILFIAFCFAYPSLKSDSNIIFPISIVLWALFFLISAFECSLEQNIEQKLIDWKSDGNKKDS